MKFMKRGQAVESNIFNRLDQKKKEILASGGDVINLSIGTPDFAPDGHVMRAVAEAALDPQNYKYSIDDTPALVSAVQRWYERRYGVRLEPDQLMSVGGSQEGLAHVAFPLAGPGDLVLAPDPGYPIFTFGPMMTGADIGLTPLLPENGWLVDLDAIDPAVADRACAMVVSYPNNPTTAYSDLLMDGRKGISFLSIPGAMEVGIEFNSLSKTYNLTGMRTSFALGNRDVIRKFHAFRSQIDYGMFLPAQLGAAAALDGPQGIVERNRAGYQARRDALCGGLRSIGWDVPDSKGTMFVWAKLPEGYTDAPAFVIELMERTGVICVPGDSFGELGKGYVRFALVVPPERMREAVRRIAASGMLGK